MVAALLGTPFNGLPPLYENYWRPFQCKTKRVILLLLDAFGWNLFQQERPRLEWLVEQSAVQDKLTSIFPSTTVAALSSLWTGYAPAQHGMVGLRLFFPEYAALVQMIRFTPNFINMPAALVEAGTIPEQFLAVPGFAEQLSAAGIPAHSFKGKDIIHSPLSLMHDRGIHKQHSYVTTADLFVQLRQLLEETAGKELYVNAYWPAIDTITHVQGPDGESVAAELHAVLAQLKKELFDKLSPAARSETVLIITGDHGQIRTTPDHSITLADHAGIKDNILMRPAGEPRVLYLYARQGRKQALIEYINHSLAEAAIAFDAEEMLDSGLLGPRPHAPLSLDRMGDVVVLMRANYILVDPDEAHKVNRLNGRHGGMTPEEMDIPWLGFQLDEV
jgi:predicted AlkP superfamily pyrophosphatase or phosphodiesterase